MKIKILIITILIISIFLISCSSNIKETQEEIELKASLDKNLRTELESELNNDNALVGQAYIIKSRAITANYATRQINQLRTQINNLQTQLTDCQGTSTPNTVAGSTGKVLTQPGTPKMMTGNILANQGDYFTISIAQLKCTSDPLIKIYYTEGTLETSDLFSGSKYYVSKVTKKSFDFRHVMDITRAVRFKWVAICT